MKVDLVAIDLVRIDLETPSPLVTKLIDLVAIDLVRIDLVTPSHIQLVVSELHHT